jgi:hypothetical protein
MIVHDSQVGQMASVFIRACAELTQARLRQRLKDTTAHRAAVAECRAEIDIILDLLLETSSTVPHAQGWRPAPRCRPATRPRRPTAPPSRVGSRPRHPALPVPLRVEMVTRERPTSGAAEVSVIHRLGVR